MSQSIAVEDLQVGMYIHLSGGWLSHPFPRSSFRIGSQEQLAVVRSLGLLRVHWSPEKSDPALVQPVPAAQGEGPADGGVAPAGGPRAAEPQATEAAQACGNGTAPAGGCSPAGMQDGTHEADPAPAPGAPDVAQAPRAQGTQGSCSAADMPGTPALVAVLAVPGPAAWSALEAQRAALQRCERRHAEAGRAFRAAQALVHSRPLQAREAADELLDDMLGQMADSGDIGIRLLAAPGSDRNTVHALNVTVISVLIGRSLGLGEQELADLGLGALLHDVGKIDLPERVRHVDDQTSPGDLAAWREHVPRGVAHGRRMELPPGALDVIAQHHEHADGSGFPDRLAGGATALAARIVAIVDRYDNLCNPPLLAQALTPHEAVSTLFAQGRARYDSAVLNAFIRIMGVYPAGSLVQLTDDRYGMVVGVNSSRPLKPRVLVHQPRLPSQHALVLNLEQVPDLGIRRSLPPARVPPEVLLWLDPRPRLAYYFEPLAHGGLAADGAGDGRPAPSRQHPQPAADGRRSQA